MNRGDIDISLSDFKEFKCRQRVYDRLIVSITDAGSLCLNGKLGEKL